MDLHGAPYGYTPFCSDRTEMDGFRFWKEGYWKNHLRGKPYHIRYASIIILFFLYIKFYLWGHVVLFM